MKTALALIRWIRHPHWTWQLRGAAAAAALIVCWYFVRSFWPGLGAGVTLIAGWYLLRLIRWVLRRVQATADAGIPLDPWRMVKDLLAERGRVVEVEERWALAMRAQGVVYDRQSPKLHRLSSTPDGAVRASINLAGIGGNLDKIIHIAADGTLAGIMHCQEVTVDPDENRLGRATITFHKRPPLQRSFALADLPASGTDAISFGVEASGRAASVRYGLSMLIGAATGAGKSVLFWNMFADILRDGRPTELTLIDPKRMEFARFRHLVGQKIGNIKIAGYFTTAEEAKEVFRKFKDEMHNRQDRLAEMGQTELTDPTEEMPIRIVAVDETLDIKDAFKSADSDMLIAISQGRATRDSVIALTQLAKIATLGDVRDMFPLRAALRTMTPENTKAILNVSESGPESAPCSRIPLSMPGVGYYVTAEGQVRKFRTCHVTDRQRDQLVRGELPEGMPTRERAEYGGPPCFGYIGRDRAGACMYVGIAGGVPGLDHPVARRRAQHRRNDVGWCAEHGRVENWWKVHVLDRQLEVHKFPSRSAAEVWEARTIKTLRPRFNILHNRGNPLSNEAMARRAGMRRRMIDAAGQYVELGRDVRAVHWAKGRLRRHDRVEAQRVKRDQFVQTVTSLR